LKQVERDLLILSMVSTQLDTELNKLITNLDKSKIYELFIKTFKTEDHFRGILTKMATDAYSRLEKKLPKT
jgi:hypothetical protein